MPVYNVSFSQYAAQLVLNYFKGTATPTAPTALYVALLTGTSTDSDTGGGFTEFTGYSGTNRPAITFGTVAVAGTGTLAAAQRITSSNAPTFTITTAGPTIISGIAITTAQPVATALNYTAGNVIWYGELTTGVPPSQSATTVSVVATDTLTFTAGNITIDLY